jgi:hypothetical protein
MNAAIGKLLPQFDMNGRVKPAEKPKVPEPAAKPKEIRREPQPAPAPKAEPPQANLLDEAYRRGYAAGLAEGNAGLAEERVRSAVRLGEERAKWSDQEAVAIVNGFGTACRELETNIASSVARILQPFLADAVRDKAIEALIEQISTLTCSSPVPVFRISGPGDLLERVKAQLETARRTGVEYQIADTLEIRVVADQTVIETQMQAWTARLKEARR